MKHTLLTFALCFIFQQVFSQTAVQPAGEGTEGSPYLISNWQELYWISESTARRGHYYEQTADIDLTQVSPSIDTWNHGAGWTPLGYSSSSAFSGNYNGNGHVINGLYIRKSSSNYVGFVGYLTGKVYDLGLTNVQITGKQYVGGVVGNNQGGVYRCFATGTVSGYWDVGGFVGINRSRIEDCYTLCDVHADYTNIADIGGFVGTTYYGFLDRCYSAGQVFYSSGNPYRSNGFLGEIYYTPRSCSDNYWDVDFSLINETGYIGTCDITGIRNDAMRQQESFENWNFDTVWSIDPSINYGYPYLSNNNFEQSKLRTGMNFYSGTGISLKLTFLKGPDVVQNCGVILGSSEVLSLASGEYDHIYTISNPQNTEVSFFQFNGLNAGTTYFYRSYITTASGTEYGNVMSFTTHSLPSVMPSGTGTELDPYLISNWQELLWVSQTWQELDKHFLQTADIDLAAADPAIETWNSGKGWEPIGGGNFDLSGVYNGGGHVIKGLYYYNPSGITLGLFSEVETEGTITNLGVIDAAITAECYAGILTGRNNGTVEQCFTTGQVNCSYSSGGLIGYNNGSVSNCFSLASIAYTTEKNIGGLIGYYYSGDVTNCYSAGSMTSGGPVALKNGLVGSISSGTFLNNYWDTESSLVIGSGGLTEAEVKGLTHTQMLDPSNFSGWDFSTIWHQDASINQGYPYLTAINNTATKLSVTTGTVASNSFLVYGFLSLGTEAVHEYGIVGGLAEDATIADHSFIVSESNPSVSQAMNPLVDGLEMGTEYFYRSYITTVSGTEYGPNISFITDTVQTVIPQGSGTEQSPYEISSWQELLWLSRTPTVWGNSFLQTADIDYAEALAAAADNVWTPIGTYNDRFTGNYDGAQHMVDNLFVDRTSSNTGFFGVIGETALINNFGLTNAQVTGSSNTGLLAGLNFGSIESCFTTGTLTGGSYTGAFVGYHNNGSVSNCYSLANIKAIGSITSVSNFIANINGGTVENCYATGSVVTNENELITNKVFLSSYTSSGMVSFGSNYWNSTTSYVQNLASVGDGAVLPLTDAEMAVQSNFEGWDFSGTWQIDAFENYGYPYLFPYASDISVANMVINEVSGISFSFSLRLSKGSDDVLSFGIIGGTTPGIEVGSADVVFNYNQIASGNSALFSDVITDLSTETEYYIRPYITTASGTTYYNEVSFTTGTLLANVPNGSGTELDPFIIDTWDDLYWLSNTSDVWDKYFLQTTDIDFADADSAITTWNGGEGFVPIGNSAIHFTGVYNGADHIIKGLYINRPTESHQAFFGYTYKSTIKNLGLMDVFVDGDRLVGSFVGYNIGNISECFSTGSIYGNTDMGGFAGSHSSATTSSGKIAGTIDNCFTLCDIFLKSSDKNYVYLFIGNSKEMLKNCYAAGKITSYAGTIYARSFTAPTYSSCYFDAYYSGNSNLSNSALSFEQMQDQASFAGWNFDTVWSIDPAINYGYPYLQTMDVVPSSVRLVKGLTAGTSFVMTNYFRLGGDAINEYGFVYGTSNDVELANAEKISVENPASSSNSQYRVTGLATDTKYYIRSYMNIGGTIEYGKLDSVTTDSESTLVPFGSGTEADPFLISNSEELHWVADRKYIRNKHYLQTADIDLNDADPALETWYDGDGWHPIAYDYYKFDGVYDGGGHSIINLKISNSYNNTAAVFSYIDTDGIVCNLGVTNVEVNTNAKYSAALAGQNLGTVEYCFATGTVQSAATSGGLVAYNDRGYIKNSFSRCKIIRTDNSDSYTGAFVGRSLSGTISNSYSTGSVAINNGSEYSDHGFLGYKSSGTISSNYWNINLSFSKSPGVTSSATGMTNSEMQLQANFDGWNFDTIWHTDPAINYGHPYLFTFNSEKPEMAVNLLFNSGYGFILKGDVLQGSESITEYGIVGGLKTEPTLDAGNADFSSNYSGAVKSEFQSRFIGLEPSTEYFVRTYAIVNNDTIYGSSLTVTTESSMTLCPEGLGTEASPFLISNWQELCWVDDISTTGLYFLQTADIDLAETEPLIETWNSGAGFSPIDMYGIYNGAGHSIYNLYINRSSSYNIGLFSKIFAGATVTDLGVVDADIIGQSTVGGIAGFNNGSIERCFTTGVFTAQLQAGGIAGYNSGDISNSFSKANLTSTNELANEMGNLVGYQSSGISVVNNYASGTVRNADGQILNNRGVFGSVVTTESTDIYGNYWDTETSGMDAGGGFDSYASPLTTALMQQETSFNNWDFTTVWNINSDINGGTPYLYPFVSNSMLLESYIIAIAGNEIMLSATITAGNKPVAEYGIVSDSIIDNVKVGNADAIRISLSGVDAYGSKQDSLKMTQLVAGTKYYYRVFAITATDTIYSHLDNILTLDAVCSVPDGDGVEATPYLISNWQELRWLSECEDCHDKYFLQTADINLADAEPSIKTWNNGSGWTIFDFSGVYNGGNHIIENLYADYESLRSSNYYGFFRSLTETAYVHDLGLAGVEYAGNKYTGSFAGNNNGIIERCFVTDAVIDASFSNDQVGGFVANNVGTISQCYFVGSVKGDETVGGFTGTNSGKIDECFVYGSVQARNTAGGFVGDNLGHISNSFTTADLYLNRYSDWYKFHGNFAGNINNGTIFNCYATGAVVDNIAPFFNNGGFVRSATISEEDTVANNYWDVQTSGQIANDGAEGEYASGMTTSQMKTQATFSGWDFGTIWHISPEYNYGYPYLQPIKSNKPNISITSVVPAGNSVKVGGNLLTGNNPVIECGFIVNAGDTVDFALNKYTVRTVAEQSGSEQSISALVEGLDFDTEYSIIAYAFTITDTVYSATVRARTHIVPSAVPEGSGTEANPYLISTCEELVWLSQSEYVWDKYFEQTADLDFSTVSPVIDTWDKGHGFLPVGNKTTNFTGSYTGNGNKIAGLYINRDEYVGLFGYLGDSANVSNIQLTNVQITSGDYTGMLAGYNKGTINQCCASGSIVCGNFSGGLVGYNSKGTILNSYVRGSVEVASDSDYYFAGFTSFNYEGNITNCYSTCSVAYISNKEAAKRGFCYYAYSPYTSASNFWNKEESGQATSRIQAVGITSNAMQIESTFTTRSWDFVGETENGTDDIWAMNLAVNDGYPYLAVMPQGGSAAGVKLVDQTANDVIFEGDVYIEGQTVTEYGVLLSKTNTEPSLDSNLLIRKFAGPVSNLNFDVFITGLTKATEYFYRAYVLVEGEEKYGTSGSFITDSLPNKWPAGSGTEAAPYLISSVDELRWISKHPDYWDAHYLQIADIDFIDAEPALDTWNGGQGWLPIGNTSSSFSGTYNGNGKTIANLYYSSTTGDYAGLFGSLTGTVKYLGITSAYIKGDEYVGIVAGKNTGSIDYCFVTGTAYGNTRTGSFVGYSSGDISNCFSRAETSRSYSNSSNYIGGFVGYSYEGTYTNCYYAGYVSNGNDYQSFCGYRSYDSQVNCFWDIDVTTENYCYGASVGLSTDEMKKEFNYTEAGWDFARETANGTDDVWDINPCYNEGYPYLSGFIPDEPEVFAKYRMFDGSSVIIDGMVILSESGSINEIGVILGLNDTLSIRTSSRKAIVPSLDASSSFVIDFDGLDAETKYFTRAYIIWGNDTIYSSEIAFTTQTAISEMPEGEGTGPSPYLISNWKELYWLSQSPKFWNAYYTQTADIDLRDAIPAIETWNGEMGWNPIGYSSNVFKGNYNGNGKTIRGLYINRPDESYIGLFGKIGTAGSVYKLGIVDVDIQGYRYVGGFCGSNNGTVEKCFVTGTVEGYSYIGGFVGYMSTNSISDCFTRTKIVSADSYSTYDAGFVGYVSSGTVENCYVAGAVHLADQSSIRDNGFQGYQSTSGTISMQNNYWDVELSGQDSTNANYTDNATGYSSAEMKIASNFSNWDFTNVWKIDPAVNDGYPYLQSIENTDGLNLPKVEINSFSSESNSITVEALIEVGGSALTSHGFVINTSKDVRTETWSHIQKNELEALGADNLASSSFTNLDANTIYFCRAYAINESGISYSRIQKIITKHEPPEAPSGSGDSEQDPYLIENMRHLYWISDQTNNARRTFEGKYFLQVNNIDASETKLWNNEQGWLPIAKDSLTFQGNYNGNNQTVSNIWIDNPSSDCHTAGLFGSVGNLASIKELSVFDITIDSDKPSGGICGVNEGALYGCKSFVNNKVSIEGGGFVGHNLGTIERCSSNGNIIYNYSRSQDSSSVSGFVAYNSGIISESVSNINIDPDYYASAGFVGRNIGTITKCIARGSTSSFTDMQETGPAGFVSENSGIISNSYVAQNNVNNGFFMTNTGEIKNCYSIGTITWGDGFGEGGTLSGNFWDSDISGDLNTVPGATPLTSTEMKRAYNYINVGWDFLGETANGEEDIWVIHPNYNNGYPFLSWEAPQLTYVGGSVYYDKNANGNKDAEDIGIGNLTVELQPVGTITGTSPNGEYIFYAEPGEYRVSIKTETPYSKGVDSLNFPIQVEMLKDTILRPVGLIGSDYSAFDVNVATVWTRCGRTVPVWYIVSNTGNVTSDLKLAVKVDSLVTIEESDADYIEASTDSLLFDVPNLLPYETRKIKLLVSAPRARMDTVLYSATLMNGEKTIVDTYVENVIRCSYDPNDVQVFPAGIQPEGNVPMGQELTYMIRFQNTGNDTAFMVDVYDTLSPILDPRSFKFISSSHPVRYFVNHDGSMRFLFEDINLLDSTSNEPESHGFVLFSVQPNADVVSGESAELKAHIFFDYNPPIVTNTVISTFTKDDKEVIQDISLSKGWNLVSFNVNPSNKASEVALASCFDNISQIKTVDEYYKSSYSSVFNTLDSIYGGKAYMIYAENSDVCSVLGYPVFVPFQHTLHSGWNMVGCPVNSEILFEDTFNTLPIKTIKNFDGFWDPESQLNSIIKFEPGKGYFIYSEGDGVLDWIE